MEKQSLGGDGAFDFTSPQFGPFSLTTTNGAASRSFTGLASGTYSISETVPVGWVQIPTACDNGDLPASVTLAASFGCPYEGEVPVDRLADVVARCVEVGGVEVALADSIGVAVPTDVRARLAVARDAIAAAGTGQHLRVHFHNTRNTGLANVATAVEEGVTVVDSSLGGIGGCPFAPGATGNVPTEDVAYLLWRMGHDTGIDLDELVGAVHWMQSDALLDRDTPGALARAGVFPRR